MTEAEYKRRIAETEAWGRYEVDLLSTVPARAPARGGESGAIADAVAGMARRWKNKEAIEAVEGTVRWLAELVEAEWFGEDPPPAPSSYAEGQGQRWKAIWAARAAG